MLHVCNAVDGTAGKAYPSKGSNWRFTTFLRDHYSILGPMGCPNIDVVNQRFPVNLPNPKALGGQPDLADVIYGIHRCSHGHGQELPGGFELITDTGGPAGHTRMRVDTRGHVQLSDRLIYGLLAVVIMAPQNANLRIPDGYYLTYGRNKVEMLVNEWWGRANDFPTIAATDPTISVLLDLSLCQDTDIAT